MTPVYGQVVRSSHGLRRKLEGRQRGMRPCGYKVWVETNKPVEGLFLGTRTLHNGWREWNDECGYMFFTTESFQVALISPGPHRVCPVGGPDAPPSIYMTDSEHSQISRTASPCRLDLPGANCYVR